MSATPIMMPAPEQEASISLSDVEIFSDLPEAVIKSLEESCENRHYSPGQTVFSMGQYDGSEFFVVRSGVLRISAVNAETGSMIVEDFTDSAIFGLEVAMLPDPTAAYQQISVTAEAELDLLVIDAESFSKLASQRPTLMRNVVTYLSQQLSTARFKTTNAKASPEQRVFSALLDYVKREQVSGDWRIDKMPKHRELADKAGVDEVDAAAAVAKLIQENIAVRDYPGLLVRDMNELNKLAS